MLCVSNQMNVIGLIKYTLVNLCSKTKTKKNLYLLELLLKKILGALIHCGANLCL